MLLVVVRALELNSALPTSTDYFLKREVCQMKNIRVCLWPFAADTLFSS